MTQTVPPSEAQQSNEEDDTNSSSVGSTAIQREADSCRMHDLGEGDQINKKHRSGFGLKRVSLSKVVMFAGTSPLAAFRFSGEWKCDLGQSLAQKRSEANTGCIL